MRYAIVTLRTDTDPTYAVKEAIESPQVEHARPLEPHERTILRTNIDTYKGSSTVRNATLTLLYSMLRTIEVALLHKDFKCKAALIEPNLRRNLGKWST